MWAFESLWNLAGLPCHDWPWSMIWIGIFYWPNASHFVRTKLFPRTDYSATKSNRIDSKCLPKDQPDPSSLILATYYRCNWQLEILRRKGMDYSIWMGQDNNRVILTIQQLEWKDGGRISCLLGGDKGTRLSQGYCVDQFVDIFSAVLSGANSIRPLRLRLLLLFRTEIPQPCGEKEFAFIFSGAMPK